MFVALTDTVESGAVVLLITDFVAHNVAQVELSACLLEYYCLDWYNVAHDEFSCLLD